MTLTQLRYLIAIVDAGLNISRAAERVHATQPGISKQIRLLEDELGLQLFARRGKNLEHLTDAGQEVVRRARLMVLEEANILALAANHRDQNSGELRISSSHTQARFVLPSAVARLRQSYPSVAVHLLPADEKNLLEWVGRGEVDLSIVSAVGTPQGCVAVPAFRWQRVLVVPRSHPLARLKRPPTIAALAAWPLVTYESALRPESSLRQAFQLAGHAPTLACTALDADLIKTYVRAGLGVGILAEMAVLADDARDLKVISIEGLLPVCTTWIVLRRDQVLCNFAMDFIAGLAPRVDPLDVRRALAGEEVDWGAVPSWSEFTAVSRLASLG
ncbi:LysR substrate-binding domain-containing protein [Cystobacter fuscus]|uniref:LysR substrate-binding domain-containing protein n=1 Tax=Cystobacter fuscus TaxID=43 RepID=UPI002B2CB2BA|nr:LysR family transcriptional regulator [Cystobacter fuscus]